MGITWDNSWYLSRFKAKVWTYGPIPWVGVLTLLLRQISTMEAAAVGNTGPMRDPPLRTDGGSELAPER